MPSANDALSGETKTFSSCEASLIVRQSVNEYAFDASSTPRSAAVSVLGRAESAVARAGGLGSVLRPAQDATIGIAAINKRRTIIVPRRL
jgi:hypothetical protein